MARLIKASDIKKAFNNTNITEYGLYPNNVVNSVPTAYDVDKVVEKLEKLETYNLAFADYLVDIQENGAGRTFVCLQDVLEIVKAGGIK